MVIVGISDSRDGGAALVIDGQLVAVEREATYAQEAGTRRFPWTAVEMCLETAGLRASDVEQIAVAGRFSPPLIARRFPSLRPLLKPDPFSPVLDAEVFVQAVLRRTGMGAADADRASEWFEGRFRERGYQPQRVTMVDVHRALAAAAYRCQPDDDVIALTLHPLGDGVSFAVHQCAAGQITRAWSQQGFSALHVHLQRCAAAIGFEPWVDHHLLWGLSARAEPDAELLHLLDQTLRADGPRLSPRAYPMPSHRGAPVYRALAQAPREVAAASVMHNLVGVVQELVTWHIREQGVHDLVLAGEVWDNPRLVAAVAELPDVDHVYVTPFPGAVEQAVGAACSVGGVAPHRLPLQLGNQWTDGQVQGALAGLGLRSTAVGNPAIKVATALEQRKHVGVFAGQAGLGPHCLGNRSVLVRADDVEAVQSAVASLGRPRDEEYVVALLADDPRRAEVLTDAVLAESSRFGSASVLVPESLRASAAGALAPDGRAQLRWVSQADDPALHAILTELKARGGGDGIVCMPLSMSLAPPTPLPGDAGRVFLRTRLDALLIGSRWVSR